MPPPPPVTEVTTAYQQAQQQLVERALIVLGVALLRGRRSAAAWGDAVAGIAAELLTLQYGIAALADPYLTAVLGAQGADTSALAAVNPAAFVDGTDGGGSWMRLLTFAPNSVPEAARSAVANSIVLNGLHDTARSAVQAGMQARPAATGYVRALRPPSCARCAILAGRHYRAMTAFARHPRCDCINVPTAGAATGWATSPRSYFDSLSTDEQNSVFGAATARAIRDGADISQLVNARSGITTVQAYGRDAKVTTVGTTKRALFGGYEVLPDGTLRKRPDSQLRRLPGDRYRRANAPRLLPEEIYHLADQFGWDRAEVLRQLRRFAYLT